VRIDGEPTRSQAALGERLGVVWLTPLMDRLFLEGRAATPFLDRARVRLRPAHASRVNAYEQRCASARGIARRSGRPGLVAALEEVMAGKALPWRRAGAKPCSASTELAPRPKARSRAPADAPWHRRGWLDVMPALAAEAEFASALAGNRQSDAQIGGAIIGPHRSDLAVGWPRKESRGIRLDRRAEGVVDLDWLAHATLQRRFAANPAAVARRDSRPPRCRPACGSVRSAASAREPGLLTGTDEALFAPLRYQAQFLSVNDGTLAATFS